MKGMCLEEHRRLLERAKEIAEPLRRHLYILAVVTKALEAEGFAPIIVGGCALEFYTFGGYATRDVDVVALDRARFGRMLTQLGFEQEGRYWFREDLDIVIECPDEELAGDRKRILEVEIEDLRCYVIGVEDLIVSRLNGYVFWHIEADREWVKQLLSHHGADIDWAYLEKQTQTEGTAVALQRIQEELANEAGEL
jgi:predicted nucleotidyltransferase